MSAQFEAIGAKGIGLDGLGTSLNVGSVHVGDHGRAGEVQLIEAAFQVRTPAM